MNKFILKHVELLCLLLILLTAAYLRLYKISEYMTFLGDEGRDAMIVKHMIVEHDLTLLGPTASVGGFYLGPIYYYFMLPFLWAWNLDPTGPAVMVALFGVATVYLVYRAGRDFFHVSVGLFAASMYALSPLVIAMSRSSWNPNVVPFFSLLLIYLLWRSVVYKESYLLFWAGVVLGIGLQLHYLFSFLFAVVGAWSAIYGRSQKMIRYYLYGIVGVAVGFSPFLAFELLKGFPNTKTIIRYLGEGKDTGLIVGHVWGIINEVTFRLFGRLVFRLPQPEVWLTIPKIKVALWLFTVRAAIFGGFGSLLGIMFSKRHPGLTDAQKRTRYGAILLLVWFVVIVLQFILYKGPIYDYYFGIFFPLPFLVVGVVLWKLTRWQGGRVASVAILIGILGFNWQGRPFLYPPNKQLDQAKRIARTALDKTDGKPFNFALLADRNSDHVFRYFFDIWGNPPITIQNEAIDPDRKTITDQLIVICDNILCQPLGHPLWEIAGFGQAEIAGSWDIPFVRIYKLVHYQSSNESVKQ